MLLKGEYGESQIEKKGFIIRITGGGRQRERERKRQQKRKTEIANNVAIKISARRK